MDLVLVLDRKYKSFFLVQILFEIVVELIENIYDHFLVSDELPLIIQMMNCEVRRSGVG
jgi:hypothetical protein